MSFVNLAKRGLTHKVRLAYLWHISGEFTFVETGLRWIPSEVRSQSDIGGGISMRVTFLAVLSAVFAVLVAATPTFAHHGFGVEFDASKCMDLKGTLTDIDWENPHAYVHLDVKGPDGKTEAWRLEMITPNALKRNGTSRQDFLTSMGKPMAARACPAKAGGTQYRGAAEFIELADGQIRVTGQLVEKITPDQFHF